MKQRILFALVMGMVTTGVVSFTLIFVLRGLSQGFVWAWIKSWMIAYVVAIPVILLVAPRVQQLVAYILKENDSNIISTPEQ